MKASLCAGLEHRLHYRVPVDKTVPALYPEAAEFQEMPRVFATGFLVGLIEWACMRLVQPHLDAGEGTVGTHVDVSHSAATPPGLVVEVRVRLAEVDGRRLVFEVGADDGIDCVSAGRHQRHVVSRAAFDGKAHAKARRALMAA